VALTEDAFIDHLAMLGFPVNRDCLISGLVLAIDFLAGLENERTERHRKHQCFPVNHRNLTNEENTMSPIMVTYTPRQYELPDEGPHVAVVADVIDLGERETFFGKKEQVRVIFLVEQLDSQGNHIELMRNYTRSAHEKSSLRKVAKMLLGYDPGHTFDAEALLGLNTGVMVVHEEGDERTFAKIDGFYKLRKGDTLLAIPQGYIRHQDRKPVDVSARVKADTQARKKSANPVKRKARPTSGLNDGEEATNTDQLPEDEQE
jgi:hypothetical protein